MGAPQLQYAIPAGGGVPVGVAGAGTVNRLTKWTAATTIGDSGVSDDGATVSFVARNLSSSSAQTWTLASSATALNIQSGLLNLDTTNSRVGIGTTSPTDKLTIGAPTGSAAFGITIGETFGAGSGRARLALADSNRGIGLTAANDILTHTYSGQNILFGHGTTAAFTERMRINGTGNLLMAGNGSAAAPIIANSTGVSGMYFPSAQTAAIVANGAVAATFSKVAGAGVALGGTTGLVFDASGTQQGLKLPATPGNTDAQTLDCYQENPLATTAGNGWPLTLSAAATWGGTQPNVTYARYVRMGSMVFCEVKLTMGAGTMTSTYGLTTIDSPFTTNTNASHATVPVAAAGVSGVGFQTGTTVYLPTIGASTTFILSWSFFA